MAANDDEELQAALRLLRKRDEIKKEHLAQEGRAQEKLQRSVQDIKIFRIGLDAGPTAFIKLMVLRSIYMCTICAAMLCGRPVTPPEVHYTNDAPGALPRPAEQRFRFHIVEIVLPHSSNAGDRVQLLFKDNNLYFVAFRFLAKDEPATSRVPFFKFWDEEIPSFFESINIDYESQYDNLERINIGAGSLEDFYHTLRKYTRDNAKR
ncbi:hypothetical protein EJB05_39908, partial [Eragrostis curvula]